MQQMSFWKIEEAPPIEYRPRIRDLPTRERPVNRLRDVGPGALSTAEVLAARTQSSTERTAG